MFDVFAPLDKTPARKTAETSKQGDNLPPVAFLFDTLEAPSKKRTTRVWTDEEDEVVVVKKDNCTERINGDTRQVSFFRR